MTEPDPLLHRLERNAVLACGALALAAWALTGGHLAAPIGVAAGGGLVVISYRGIKGGIDALVGVPGVSIEGHGGRGRVAFGLVKFFTRYAILAGAAYVIMARLQLPPVAIVAGASSLVVAVVVEALRPRGRSRDHIDLDKSPSQ